MASLTDNSDTALPATPVRIVRGQGRGPDAPRSVQEVTQGVCCGDGCGVLHTGYLRSGRVAGLDCDQPVRVVRGCGAVEVWKCSNHRESRCVPCSWTYRRRLSRIAEAGTRQTGYMYLLTLTAPGDGLHVDQHGEVCPCTPAEGVDLGEWNASAASRWNLLRTRLRAQHQDLQYLRAVEVQKRGALHLHVIVWSPDPLDKLQLRRLAIGYGFGHSLDLSPITPGSRKHAYYVAKYVTKACDQRENVPWAADLLDRSTGEIRRVDALATYRTWSASQGWGLTMKEIRATCSRAAGYQRAPGGDGADGPWQPQAEGTAVPSPPRLVGSSPPG